MDGNIVLSSINLNELCNLLGAQIKADIAKAIPTNTQVPQIETPIGFEAALLILGLKERTLRAKISAREIPYYQQGGRLYFFESELIAYVRQGKVKTMSEIQTDADSYINSTKKK